MDDLTISEKAWHVMRQLQTLADYERIPWYLPDVKAMKDFGIRADEEPDYLSEPEVMAFVDELLGRDILTQAVTSWWPLDKPERHMVARRLYYLDNWATEGSLVRTAALNLALQGRFEEVLTYLLGAGDATGKRCFVDIRQSIRLVIRS